MLRLTLITILNIAIVSTLIACSSGNDNSKKTEEAKEGQSASKTASSSEPVEGDWLIYHLNAEPATLNPITASDAYESTVNNGKIYETLIERNNETLELDPLLAESWEISEDKLKYTFKIREGIKWHDGTPFTSEDVVFSYKTIMNPKVDTPQLRSYFQEIKDVKAIDDLTVEFTYARPYFLALEFCGGMPIVPKHIFDEGDFNTNPAGRAPIGTGPYKFVKWTTGRDIVVEKNQDYWGEKPNLDRIVFKIITDNTVAFQVLKRGDLDVSGLTPIQWERQTNSSAFQEGYDKLSYFTPNYSYIGWNSKKPFFADKQVRTAMTHLVNRELILNKILYNLGAIVTNPFYINSPEYDKSIEPLEYNPQKAEQLLKEAGWVDSDGDGIRDKDGVKFAFEFLIPGGSETGEKIATILKEELDNTGIQMDIRKTEWAVFTTRLTERNFDAVTLAWSMGVESDPYQIWSSTQAESGSNFIGFKNQEVDKLINEARTEFDREKRKQLYNRFAEIIHEEQPYTFLFCRKSTVAVNKRFENVVVHPLGIDPVEWYVPLPLQVYSE
ncbi:MAG: peptide-binding protein [Thermodesulfobacteriota bacterium]|nr:MAG: peptide-binding protein [Thermodesulfobacteriota bacterium]